MRARRALLLWREDDEAAEGEGDQNDSAKEGELLFRLHVVFRGVVKSLGAAFTFMLI